MKIKICFILLVAIITVNIGVSDASIVSNSQTAYIGGNQPDIIDEPSDYLLTPSDFNIQDGHGNTFDKQPKAYIISGSPGSFTCKPKVENWYGYYSGQPEYCEGIAIVQTPSFPPNNYYSFSATIIALHPYVNDYDAIMKNIKDTYSIRSNYRARFENFSQLCEGTVPELCERAFFMPRISPFPPIGAHESTLVVQSGNIILMISGSASVPISDMPSISMYDDNRTKDLLIDFADQYLFKIAQLRHAQLIKGPIIQVNMDKTNFEVGDTFNIEFQPTVKALITVKNNNKTIDSFVLNHTQNKNYIVDKASGDEIIEITSITAKGITGAAQLYITTKDKPPIQIQIPTKVSPGFDVALSVLSITATLSVLRILKKRIKS